MDLLHTAILRRPDVPDDVHRRRGAGQHAAADLKLRFTKAARRSLKRAHRVKLRIKVAFTPTGGATQRTAVSLTLTR